MGNIKMEVRLSQEHGRWVVEAFFNYALIYRWARINPEDLQERIRIAERELDLLN
jgi:hypothetical protein